MEDHGTLFVVWRLQPKRNAEWFFTFEVSQWQIHRIIAGKFDRISCFAGHNPVIASKYCRLSVLNGIGQFATIDGLELKTSDLREDDC